MLARSGDECSGSAGNLRGSTDIDIGHTNGPPRATDVRFRRPDTYRFGNDDSISTHLSWVLSATFPGFAMAI